MVYRLNQKREGQAISDGSGRIENIKNSIIVIKENPIIGIGPGAKVYQNYVKQKHNIADNYEIPHNIVFQALVYYGIVGFLIMALFFLFLLRNAEDTPESKILYVCLLGAFFIPDIFVSRFFLVAIILMWIGKSNKLPKNKLENQYNEAEVNY